MNFSPNKQTKTNKLKQTIMTKKEIEGAYAAPELMSLCFHCEEGFAQSLTIDGYTLRDGVWDSESNDF